MPRLIALKRFIACSVLMAASPLAFCTTYYVSPSGNNTNGKTPTTAFNQIQTAINAVAADYVPEQAPTGGDTILVASGTYDPFVTTVTGTKDSPILIKGDTSGTRPVLRLATKTGVAFEPGSAWTTFTGFNVLGNAASITYAEASTDDAENNPQNYPQYNSNCIFIDGANASTPQLHPVHITIINNYVGYCSGGGVSARQADYITITQNTVYCSSWWSANGTSAISINVPYQSDSVAGLSTDPTKQKIFITQNLIYANEERIPWDNPRDSGNHKITDGEGIIIDTNLNRDCPQGGCPNLDPYAGVTVIENNVIYSNGSQAIEIFASDHILVDHNSTYGDANDTYLAALASGFATRPEIGISYSHGDITVINNIFVSVNQNSPPVQLKYNTANAYFSHNLLWNIYQKTNTSSLLSSAGLNATNVIADPLYVGPPPQSVSVNLDVRAGSPAQTVGYGYLTPRYDAANQTRTNVSSVGAYNN